MRAASWNRRRHLGFEFLIWNRERTWFWLLRDPRAQGAVIAVGPDEARAIREACWSIEERVIADATAHG